MEAGQHTMVKLFDSTDSPTYLVFSYLKALTEFALQTTACVGGGGELNVHVRILELVLAPLVAAMLQSGTSSTLSSEEAVEFHLT